MTSRHLLRLKQFAKFLELPSLSLQRFVPRRIACLERPKQQIGSAIV